MNFPEEEYALRVKNARKIMGERGIDVCLITDPFNYEYFSGQKSEGNNAGRRWFMILPLDKDPIVIGYGRINVTSKVWKVAYPTWVKDRRMYVDVPFTLEPVIDWGIRGAIEDLGLSKATIGTELGLHTKLGMSFYDFIRLRGDLPEAKFVDAGDVFWGCRLIKTEREIEKVRTACDMGTKAWHKLFDEVKVGMTSEEAERLAKIHYLENGADAGGQVLRGATGPGGTFQNGDLFFIDGGASYQGYQMDCSRVVYFGTPTAEYKANYKGIFEVLDAMMDAMKPGAKCSDIMNLANRELKKRGMPEIEHLKRLGHGIGLTSEPPSINDLDDTLLQEGMTLTPEPRVIAKEGIINAEDHVVIRKNGVEILDDKLTREMLTK